MGGARRMNIRCIANFFGSCIISVYELMFVT